MKFAFRIQITLFILLIVLLISCISTPSIDISGNKDSHNISIDVNRYIDPIIIKGIIDFTDPMYRFLWETYPHDGTLIFFSSIPRKANREEEVSFAVKEAARQASILHNVKVNAKFAVKRNMRNFRSLESIIIQYDEDLIYDLKEKLKILHHYRDNEGTYVLSELDGVNFSGDLNGHFNVRHRAGYEPDWLYSLPVFPGYLVSIGTAQRSRYKIDSIRKADEQALAGLAKQRSVVVKTKRTDNKLNISTSVFSETNYEVTSTSISGFYVLGRWSTDNGNSYHTLAVCPIAQ